MPSQCPYCGNPLAETENRYSYSCPGCGEEIFATRYQSYDIEEPETSPVSEPVVPSAPNPVKYYSQPPVANPIPANPYAQGPNPIQPYPIQPQGSVPPLPPYMQTGPIPPGGTLPPRSPSGAPQPYPPGFGDNASAKSSVGKSLLYSFMLSMLVSSLVGLSPLFGIISPLVFFISFVLFFIGFLKRYNKKNGGTR